MKRFLLFFLFLVAVLMVQAMPARRGVWRTLTLADGSTVKAQLVGDEYAHCYVAADGTTYSKAQGGRYQRADRQAVARRGAQRRRQANAVFSGRRKADISGKRGNYQGVKKGLIILVNFQDTRFKSAHNQAFYNRVANEDGLKMDDFKGSIKDYFRDQSDGKFTIDFDVVGPVTVSQKASYYGNNDDDDQDEHPEEMIAEACRLADSQVDFSKYDWGGNGEVDQIYVIYAGQGEAAGGADETIWPHASTLGYAGMSLKLDGVKIDSYACSAEMGLYGVDGIGTICHEFSHCLGYPDLYDVFYEGHFGMSDWDLMDYGGYNDDGFTPAGYTAYEKWIAGWIDYVELGDQDVKVDNLKPTAQGGSAYVLYNKGNRNEYYLLENRQRTGWDAGLPASGLSVIHVDYDANCWINNVVNATGTFRKVNGWTADFTNDHQRLTIVHADNDDDSKYWDEDNGQYTRQTLTGDLYPYKTNNTLSDSSKPAFGLYNKNADGTRKMGVKVTDIANNGDGTVSFQYTATVTTEPTPEGQVFYESFDKCAGKGGNDDAWSGIVGGNKLNADNEGWTYTSGGGADQCAKFGNKNGNGQVSSPSFDLTGRAKVTFKAAPFGTDGRTLTLKYDGVEVGTYTLEPNQWTTITATITGSGSGSLTFVPAKRFFLDEVRVVAEGTSTGIEQATMTTGRIADHRIYTLQGQYVGTDFSALPSGIYIVGGKKIVK